MMSYNYKIAQSIGGRREQQDCSAAKITRWGLLVVVCDGMGGPKGGAIASDMAVNIILQDITQTNYPSPSEALCQSITKANAAIYKRAQTDETLRGMGTTVTAMLMDKQHATLAHVGDSRIYQLRPSLIPGRGLSKVFRTNDHSKVFELVKRGILSEEQARISYESNIILRALGIKPAVDIEIHDHVAYLKGDRFLLCTDGVCGAVPEPDLLDMLQQHSGVEATVNHLISTIDQMGKNNGGEHDNLSAALIECTVNSTIPTIMNRKWKIVFLTLSASLLVSFSYIGYTLIKRPSTGIDRIESMDKELKQLKESNMKDSVEIRRLSDSLLKFQKNIDSLKKLISGRRSHPTINSSTQRVSSHANMESVTNGLKENKPAQ